MTIKVILINLAILIAFLGLLEMGVRLNNSIAKSPANLTIPHSDSPPEPKDLTSTSDFSSITPPPDEYMDKFRKELFTYPNQQLEKNYPKGFLSKENRKSGSYQVVGKIKNTDVSVYDVLYRIDDFGRRAVENQSQKVSANKFALTFGCSFTFGEGLTQGHDYPSQLAKKLDSSWKVYNFGYPGYGPNDVLDHLRLQSERYLAGIEENEGVFLWFFIPDHITRFLCPWVCYSRDYSWIRSKSEYTYEDEKLVTHGSFNKSSNPTRVLFDLLSKSEIIQRIGYRVPPQYTPNDFDLFIRSLRAIVDHIPNRTIKKKYVIIFYKFKEYPLFKSLLIKHGFAPIEFFRIHEHVEIKNQFIPADGHPSSEFNWYLSEVIKNRIQSDFQ